MRKGIRFPLALPCFHRVTGLGQARASTRGAPTKNSTIEHVHKKRRLWLLAPGPLWECTVRRQIGTRIAAVGNTGGVITDALIAGFNPSGSANTYRTKQVRLVPCHPKVLLHESQADNPDAAAERNQWANRSRRSVRWCVCCSLSETGVPRSLFSIPTKHGIPNAL